ncbi:GLPGLI family protein [Flavobacterium sp. j3]|uniref:GLPGLI family protein n=1 Tax=Flavobacterium aureirubrum TaxID=3133147 RepID=A0ABU9N6Z8_9FLAO
MKKFSFILLLFYMITFSQNKSGEVTYVIKSIDFENKIQNTKNVVDDIKKIALEQKFLLSFGEKKSKFLIIENLDKTEGNEKNRMLNKLATLRFTCDYSYYLNIEEKLEYFNKNDGALIKVNFTNKSWEITTESKIIDKYLCYKAIYKYDYLARDKKVKTRIITAWFAPSLPFSYGPKNYNGLPGLILELQDWDTTFLATKIELSDKEIEIDFPKGKTITQEEYEKKVLSRN